MLGVAHLAERHHEGESFFAASPGGLMGPERVLGSLRIFQLFAQRMDLGFLTEGARIMRRFPVDETGRYGAGRSSLG